MTVDAGTRHFISQMNHARQIRQYHPDPVPEDLLNELLQIARWSGSSRNTQPWHFVVINDKEKLRELSELRTPINWVADAPLGIAIVLDGTGGDASEAYDEGRVTERIMIGARILGLGAGLPGSSKTTKKPRPSAFLGSLSSGRCGQLSPSAIRSHRRIRDRIRHGPVANHFPRSSATTRCS